MTWWRYHTAFRTRRKLPSSPATVHTADRSHFTDADLRHRYRRSNSFTQRGQKRDEAMKGIENGTRDQRKKNSVC